MAKGKDFYGKEISEVIEQACKDLGASREDLDIEVLETGSAGIFGLCKKKAHIRVQHKTVPASEQQEVAEPPKRDTKPKKKVEPKVAQREVASSSPDVSDEMKGASASELPAEPEKEKSNASIETSGEEQEAEPEELEEDAQPDPPSEENIAAIQADLYQLLTLMGLPSEVQVVFEQNTVQCNISGPHEADIVGSDGRTLDSLQYLLRKIVSQHLPDKIMLALNAGDFRERRAEELKLRAIELATQVKEDGKTQAIPALNPSERRVVHMILQEDKGVRSRSVGEGLFKKVLIYKPGKGRRPVSKKRRGGQGGRPSGD
jgi:spoIIIJ-associated protein